MFPLSVREVYLHALSMYTSCACLSKYQSIFIQIDPRTCILTYVHIYVRVLLYTGGIDQEDGYGEGASCVCAARGWRPTLYWSHIGTCYIPISWFPFPSSLSISRSFYTYVYTYFLLNIHADDGCPPSCSQEPNRGSWNSGRKHHIWHAQAVALICVRGCMHAYTDIHDTIYITTAHMHAYSIMKI